MGLRTTTSTTAVSNNSDAAKIMAPALTEPVSHQSKISSPAQAASPRPIISDSEQQLNRNNNSGQYLCVKNSIVTVNRSETFVTTIGEQIVSNGPTNGPVAVTHMDQINNDIAAQSNDQQQPQLTQNSGDHISSSTTSRTIDGQSDELESDRGVGVGGLVGDTQQSLPQAGGGFSEKDVAHQLVQELAQHQQVCSQSLDLLGVSQTVDSQTVDGSVPSSQLSNTSSSNIMGKDYLKDNADMEQMLGELATSSDIDLLQVFKSFESAPAGENLCDLAGGLSLFNDVDVMNMALEDVVANTSPVKECPTQEIIADIEKKRAKMMRECDFMVRRLRKIQARHMGRHISEEIYGVYEYSQNLIKRKERETKSISTMTPINQLQSDKHKSASSLRTMLKRIDSAATTQQTSAARTNQMYGSTSSVISNLHADSRDSMGSKNPLTVVTSVVPTFDQNGLQQLQQCTGLLSTELKFVNDAFDSDATASSSGGESVDELVTYNNVIQQPLTIAKRAAWRWARDRARIASRWTWLLSQISDLEYRIRQHHELYLLLKKNNGPVTFENSPHDETAMLDHTLIPLAPPQQSVNGYRGTLPGNLPTDDDNEKTDDDQGCTAARTRAFRANTFRKRKLLQSTNLHKISKKSARTCNIKCGCRWPVHPCLLCTGRPDPTAPRDLPDMLSRPEQVALLDPCFHPKLSFPEDESQSIHFEGVLRQSEWQSKVIRNSTKSVIKGALAMQKATEREDRIKKNSDSSINSRKLSNKKLGLVATKLKKTRNNNRKLKKGLSHLLKNKSRKNSHSLGSDISHDMDIASPNGSFSRSINPSPTPGNSHRYENRIYSERRNKNAYDIDNIVIPYSMAASNRVEVLSYKEIPTPKWKILEDENEQITQSTSQIKTDALPQEVPVPNDIAETEDISAEAFQQRHERALTEERRKFSTFLKFPYSTRSRANRRTDSQADSSGANTPDPTSPAPSASVPITATDQESAPSPAPQTATESSENTIDNAQFSQPTPVSNNGSSTFPSLPNSATKVERRRTVSVRKIGDTREELLRRSHTPDIKETIPPYELLEFPLPNETLDQMIQTMPSDFKNIINDCINMDEEAAAVIKALESQPPNTNNIPMTDRFPNLLLEGDSDETESAVSGVFEDPNDPEWIETARRT